MERRRKDEERRFLYTLHRSWCCLESFALVSSQPRWQLLLDVRSTALLLSFSTRLTADEVDLHVSRWSGKQQK